MCSRVCKCRWSLSGAAAVLLLWFSLRAAAEAIEVSESDTIRYEIDPGKSTLQILVFSAGPLAKLGHNHLMTGALHGWVSVDYATAQFDFELSMLVDQLVVDDPTARLTAGAAFSRSISESERATTRRLLLRADGLDARHFPAVTMRSVGTTGTLQAPQVTTRITLRGVSRDFSISPRTTYGPTSVAAVGEFALQQSDFGIEPFSIAFGALRTDDRLHVKFTLLGNTGSLEPEAP
jgi:polyisoprenoid-binding protein YceI